ncbi:hypothetical protein AB1N83_003635 [Pleurotus pulmonarius]
MLWVRSAGQTIVTLVAKHPDNLRRVADKIRAQLPPDAAFTRVADLEFLPVPLTNEYQCQSQYQGGFASSKLHPSILLTAGKTTKVRISPSWTTYSDRRERHTAFGYQSRNKQDLTIGASNDPVQVRIG